MYVCVLQLTHHFYQEYLIPSKEVQCNRFMSSITCMKLNRCTLFCYYKKSLQNGEKAVVNYINLITGRF